jgi:Tol biopolymer transport system component
VLFVQGGDLYTVDIEGGDPALLHDCGDIGGCQWPAWSPDGSTIAFRCHIGGLPKVCLLPLDGSEPTLLAPDLEYGTDPAWSPDGSTLLVLGYTTANAGQPGPLVLMLANPQGEILSSFPSDRERHRASFSRDGSQIIYYETPPVGQDSGVAGIHVMDLDGTNAHMIHELPNDLDYWVTPVWRP